MAASIKTAAGDTNCNPTNVSNDDDTSSSSRKNALAIPEIEKLNFDIFRYSSFSTNYIPENILLDLPHNQSSRWSVQSNSPPQYLTLKLKRPAVVRKIKFGKFEKPHVCNIKKFRIYGGMEEERLTVLLEGGLKNDSTAEIFNLRSTTEDGTENLPILYVKIVPLLSWGPTFNFSIWYVELLGQDDPMFTGSSLTNYNMLREVEIVRMCLKHFRQQGYDAAFKALQEQTQVHLEHPLIGELHKSLVVSADFEKAEQFLVECVSEGLMDEFLKRQDYKHSWSMQQAQSVEQPGNRGGHQLVMDTKKRLIYLYGGWDGFQDLSDLWAFDIVDSTWTLLCERSEQVNGPTPRSCHKMIFDPVNENIFMLGRYLDNSIRTTEYIKSDFFLYDTRARTWLQICDDTSQVGGPQLVYDHQMCIDADKRTIYVFGGKILTPRSVNNTTTNEPEYSGLFSYHIATNTWTQIFVDCHHPSASLPDVQSIKSRITHCMVFHNKHRKLYIYGGQRGKEDIDDFISYDVDTQAMSMLNRDVQQASGWEAKHEPSPGYTLRATIDCDRDEIYVFSSLSKLKERRDIQHSDASNSFWVYSLRTNKWSRIYTYRHNANEAPNTSKNVNASTPEPCPRYAHQLVYDDEAKQHYLFGGNPGKSLLPQLRLDDFWTLVLEKPKRPEILRHCRFLVRKLRYEEMARSDPYQAMTYLRSSIAEVIDHSDAEQLNKFHKLASLLFKPQDSAFERSALTTPALGKTQTLAEEAAGNECATATPAEEDCSTKSDCDMTHPTEDLSMESCESAITNSSSGVSDAVSYTQYRRGGGKRARHDYLYELRRRRTFLFNKIVKLMPASMVQPERNLSDFVVM